MRASVVTDFGAGFQVMDVELAAPLAHEVVVEVRASGLCQSDHTVATRDVGFPLPAVLGHEVAGVVVEVGPSVTELAVGDHVVGCCVKFCGSCQRCRSGRPAQCLNPGAIDRPFGTPPRLRREGMSELHQGFALAGFAERVLVHENQVARVSTKIPFEQAALIGCGVVTGAGAVFNTAKVQAGETVVVIGVGGVGINAVQGAALAGASEIIAIDLDDAQLERATNLGATSRINSASTDPVEAVREVTGHGADHVFDFVGIRSVTAQGFEMVGNGGGLYLIGAGEANPGIDVDASALMNRHAKVQGVGMGSVNPKIDIPLYAEYYAQGRLRLDELVSATTSLDAIDQGYETMKQSSVSRVVITSF